MKKVLVVAAHPDDELLGVGGTVIKHTESGDEVSCLILGQGAMARSNANEDEVNTLRQQAEAAAKVVGFKNVVFADLPDNAFDTVALLKIVKEVEKVVEQFKPDIIYTHHEFDLNVDHRLTFEAVLTACRPCNDNCPAEILAFETLSSTEWQSKGVKQFVPTVYTDVSEVIDKKIRALENYESELRPYPHSRSKEGVRLLAQYRGLEAGLTHAEAFHLVRRINR